MVRGYEARFWYWELTVLWRKALIFAALIYAPRSINAIGLGILLLLTMILANLAHYMCRPFIEDEVDNIESLALTACLVSLLMAVYVEGKSGAGDRSASLDIDGTWGQYLATMAM